MTKKQKEDFKKSVKIFTDTYRKIFSLVAETAECNSNYCFL